MEDSPVRSKQEGSSTGSSGRQFVQLTPDESKEEFSPLSSPGQHYSDDAWKSETTETDGQSEFATDQSGGHGDSMTSTHSIALQSAISEVSKEYLSGVTRTGQNLSENDSSDISSEGDHKPQDHSGHYPETAAGLSDNDWNPYGTGPESDTNCTPRVSGRERPLRVLADGDSGALRESTLPSYSAFDPLRTSSKVNDLGANASDTAGLSLTDNATGGRQALTLPSIPEIVGENHNNSGVGQKGSKQALSADTAQGKYQSSERQDGGKAASLRPWDSLSATRGQEDFSNSAIQHAPDSRGPSPAMSSCSASTGSTVQELRPSSKSQQDSKKTAGLSNGQPERPRSAGGDLPEASQTYMSVADRQWLMRNSLSPTQLSEESLAWRATKFLEEVEQKAAGTGHGTLQSQAPESQSQDQGRGRSGASDGTAGRVPSMPSSLAASAGLQGSATAAPTAPSSHQSELARARGVPDGVVGSMEPIWSKAGSTATAASDGSGATSQSLQNRPASGAGGDGVDIVKASDASSKTSTASDRELAGLQALADAYKRRTQMLDGASAQLPAASAARPGSKPGQALVSVGAKLNIAESQISYARIASSGEMRRAQPPDLRGSVRDSSLVCRTSEIGRGQQELGGGAGGQVGGPRGGGGLDRDALDARVKSVLSEASYLDSYRQVLANSQAAGYGYLSRCRVGTSTGAMGSLDYNQLHLDLTEIQSSLDAPHPPPAPPADTPRDSEAGSEAVPSTSTTPDRNRLLWDYGADLEYDETGRFVGNPDHLQELGHGRVGHGGARPKTQYNSEGEETRGSGSTRPDDQSSEDSHHSVDQALDLFGGFDLHHGGHGDMADLGGRMVDRVADILRRENPDAQAIAILQEVQAQERQLFSDIIMQSRMNRSYDGQSSVDVSTLNSTLTEDPIKRQLFQSTLSSPNASSLAAGEPLPPPSSQEVAVSRYGWEAVTKGSSSTAMSYAQSLISSQMRKVVDRSFNHSMDFRTPLRRDIVCYPVFGQSQGPRQGEEGSQGKEGSQGSTQGASQRASSGGAGEGQGRGQQHDPQLLHEFPVRDRNPHPDSKPQEAWDASPSTGRTGDDSSASRDQSDLTASSPSSYSASSPGDSDLSGGRTRGKLRPYKPPGVNYVYYTESDTGSVADSVTTVESTHTGSDDAVGPAFPPHVLGSRQAVPVTQGLYYRSRTTGITAEPALSTIEEKSSEKSTQDDKNSADSGSQDGRQASKTPPADRMPEGRGAENSRVSQNSNGGQGSRQQERDQGQGDEKRQGGNRQTEASTRDRPGGEIPQQQVRREPLGSGRSDSEPGVPSEQRRQELDASGGRGDSDNFASNRGRGRERSEGMDLQGDRGSSLRGPRDRFSPSATQMSQVERRWVHGEDREESMPSRPAPPRQAWQDDQGPQELPPNLDRDPRLTRPALRDRISPPPEKRLSSSPVHEGRRSPGPSPHSSPIPFRHTPDLEPLEQLPMEEEGQGVGEGRAGRTNFQDARNGREGRREEPMEVGRSAHRTDSNARVEDELSDSDPALALDRQPLNQRVRLLQQALEQEFDPAMPANLAQLWAQFSNLNASAGDTTSTLDSSRLSHLADLLRRPAQHLVRSVVGENEAALQQERLAQEEIAAQAREQQREEMRRLSSGPLSEEEVNGSYSQFTQPAEAARVKDRQAPVARKQAAVPHKEPAPQRHRHGESADTLYSIPEDTGLNSSSSLFHPDLQPTTSKTFTNHIIDPNMKKLRDKIQQQKDKIDRERRKEIRRLQKLMQLEQLLKSKKRGEISEHALIQQLHVISSTSASSDSELVSDSTVGPTLSSHSVSEDSSTTAKDSSTELAHRPHRARVAMMEEAYNQALERLQRKTAATQTRSPTSRSLRSKDEKIRMNEKLRIVGEMQRQRQQRESRSPSDQTRRKGREDSQRKRDAATMYPSPSEGRRTRDKGRRVRVSTSAVQTTPGLQRGSHRPGVPVPALSLSRSRSRSQGRSASFSPSRPQSRSPSMSSLKHSRSRSPPQPFSHTRSPPQPCSHSRSAGALLNKAGNHSPQRTSSMFIPENPENFQPIKKKAKRKTAKPKIAGPGVAWFIPMEEEKLWRKPLSEVQAQAPLPPPRPNDGRDPWRPEGVSLHLLQQLVASQAEQAERRRLGGEACLEETEESTDYSAVENRARKPITKMSLQEAFQTFKQDFISHSRQRDKRRVLAAEERRLQEHLRAEQERIFQDCRRQEPNVYAHPMADLHYQPKKRVFTTREMREMTEKKYKKLPEVVEKEKDRKRKDIYLMNRIRARVFNKKVQKQVLQRSRGRH